MSGDVRRHKIDFIMVKNRFKNQVKVIRIYSGMDTDRDHNLGMMKCNFKCKNIKRRRNTKWWQTNTLKYVKEKFKEHTNKIKYMKNRILLPNGLSWDISNYHCSKLSNARNKRNTTKKEMENARGYWNDRRKKNIKTQILMNMKNVQDFKKLYYKENNISKKN